MRSNLAAVVVGAAPGRRGARALAAIAAVLAATPASAHEVLHQVERGRAVAVRAYESDGEALAHRAYQVYSPADPEQPHQEGRTDRRGWLAFVPDVAGKWRVKVLDETGHGLDLKIDAAPGAPAGAPADGAPSPAAFALRPLLGLLAIAAVFAALLAFYRRKRSGP